jgi:hypothetical protein
MKRLALFGLLVLTLSFLSMTTYSFAASISPKFTYGESWAEKVVRYSDEGESWYEEIESGKFTIKVTLPTAGINVDQIDADTEFFVEIGDFAYSFQANEDPKYLEKPGRTSAKVVNKEWNEHDKEVTSLTATAKWSATKLSLTFTATPYLWTYPLAYNYAVDQSLTEPGPINDSTNALVRITIKGIPVEHPFSVVLTGTSSVKHLIKQEEEFDLCKVSLKGTEQ